MIIRQIPGIKILQSDKKRCQLTSLFPQKLVEVFDKFISCSLNANLICYDLQVVTFVIFFFFLNNTVM